MLDKSQQQQTLEQHLNTMRGVVRGLSGAFAYYVEILLRWRFGTRCFSLFEALFAPILFSFYWLFTSTVGALKDAFSHHQAHALFSMGNFFLLSFAVNVYQNIRTIRLRIHPEREAYSQTAGPCLSIFNKFPKAHSFWIVRLAYEPALVFFLGIALPILHVVEPALGGYFVLVSFALFLKSFIDWDMYCDARRDILDSAYLGPILGRIASGTATEEDVTIVHLAQIPTATSPEVFRKAKALPSEVQSLVTPVAGIILAVVCFLFPIHGKAEEPKHHYLFVVNNGSDSISVIEDDKVVKTIELDGLPYGIAVSPNKIYVTGGAAKNMKITTADNLNQMNSHRLTQESGGTIWVIDPIALSVTRKIAVDTTPTGLAFTPDGKKALAACKSDDVLDVIDATTDQVVALIPDHIYPTDVKFIGPDRALVVNSDSAEVVIVSLASNSITQRIPIGFGPQTAAIWNHKAYVGSSVIDLQTMKVSQGTFTVGKGGMAFSNGRGFIPEFDTGMLAIADMHTGKLTRMKVDAFPFSIAVVNDKAYVTLYGHIMRGSGFSEHGYTDTDHIGGEVAVISLPLTSIVTGIPVGRSPLFMATSSHEAEEPIAEPQPGAPIAVVPPATSALPAPTSASPAEPPTPAAAPATPIDAVKQSVNSLKNIWKKRKPQ